MIRDGVRSASIGLAVLLASASAVASGREGEALVDVVRWIVFVLVAALCVCTLGGVLVGGYKARQKDESVAKGSAKGFLKGIVAFLGFCAVSLAVVTIVGAVYLAYAFFTAGSIRPSTTRTDDWRPASYLGADTRPTIQRATPTRP